MAYEYESYGPLRGNPEPGYFETRDHLPEQSGYANEYSSADQSRDNNNPSSRRRGDRTRTLPFNQEQERMGSTATERSEGSEHVSPETIAAITERIKREVLEHLRQTGNVDGPPRAESVSQRQPSTTSSRSTSPNPHTRRVYTPPSPVQSQSSRSAYPPPPPPPMASKKSPPASPLDKPSAVRFTDRDPKTRPAGAPRTYSSIELSTIDLKWGQLFENDGTPTHRLGQFLRGLANHIIDDYSTKRSIVVTPDKLTTYYSKFPLDKEIKGLTNIFRSQRNEHISKFFQDLGCQHFLIQEDSRKEPTIPALTPLGFSHFMTITLLAYPEEEAKRLEKVVLDCPIDADGQMIDGKPERLPKQISRHLLPEQEDRASRRLLDNAIADFLENFDTAKKPNAPIRSPSFSRHGSTSQSRRPPVEVHQAAPPKSQPIERERKPYGGTPSDSGLSEDTVKIERERQPYSAQPGNGKVHDDGNLGPNSSSTRRRESVSSRSRRDSTSRPRDIPDPVDSRHHRTQSTTSSTFVPPPGRSSRRRSSPPIRNFGRSSEPSFDSQYSSRSSVPNSQPSAQPYSASTTSSTYPPPPPPIDIRSPRREAHDYLSRSAEKEAIFATGEFNSPRDAERYDRYQESRSNDGTSDRYEVPYERGSVHIDPVESRGAPAEEWYRDPARGPGYYGSRGY